MNRRALLQQSALIIGGTLLGADGLLARNISWEAMEDPELEHKGFGIFTKTQVKLLNEVGETILPTTDTPGAKAAKVGQFIAVIVTDCYDKDKQTRFMEALGKIDLESKSKFGKTFLKLSAAQRHDLLTQLDAQQKMEYKSHKKGDPDPHFRMIKDLVLWGYFTSEIGATQALRFLEYPGRYETIDYKKGDRAWGGY